VTLGRKLGRLEGMVRYFFIFFVFISSLVFAQNKIADIFSHGTVEEVRAILEAGHGVNQRLDRVDFRDPAGYSATPLILASESNSPDVVKLLIDSGTNVNEKMWDSSIYTAFVASTRNTDLAVMQLLLDSGVDFESQSESAFLWAASLGNDGAIQLLLANGLDIEDDSNLLEAAFSYALQNGQDRILERLLELGATIDDKDIATSMNKLESFQTLLDNGAVLTLVMATNALLNGVEDERVISLLLARGVYADVLSESGETPLMVAASRHQPEGVKTLLKAGADVNAVAINGSNALMKAVYCYDLQYSKDVEKANTDAVETVKSLLDAGADVNSKTFIDSENGQWLLAGTTVLINAVTQTYCPVEIVSLLLEAGANVNDVNIYNETALMIATDAAFDLILEYKPDLNVQDKEGYTALHKAVRHPRTGIGPDLSRVKKLLEEGANTELKDNQGETAIFRAVALQEPLETFHLLLEYDADIHVKDKYDQSLLFHAVANPNAVEVVRELIALGLDVNDPESNVLANAVNLEITQLLLRAGTDVKEQGGPALQEAAHDEDRDRLDLLIDAGADVNYQYESRSSISLPIISHAIQWGHIELVETLIEKGANLELRDITGRTPLLWAGYRSNDYRNLDYLNIKINRLLIEAGADVNARAIPNQHASDEDSVSISDTALIQAARRGSAELADMLVKAGADLDAQNDEGQTALMVAAQADHRELIELLMKAGADLTLRDKVGKTALNFTVYGTGAYELLGGGVAGIDIFDFVRDADAESLAAVLDNKDFDVNVIDLFGQHLLIYAAGNNPDSGVIRVLAEHGANMNQSDIYGWTALMHAARDNKNVEVLKAIVDAGADLEQKNTRNMTALMVAAENARSDSVKSLIENGANVNTCNNDEWCGYTALQYAAIGGDIDTLGMLLELQQDIVDLDWVLTIALDKNTHLESVKALIALGADPKFKVYYAHNDSFAYNMLGKAIGSGSLDKVRLMVESGVSVNSPCEGYWTPLMSAAYRGNVPIMQYLLDVGAKPSAEVLDFYRQYRDDKQRNPEGKYDEAFEKKLLELTQE
jgi:ankyrin repeat protein